MRAVFSWSYRTLTERGSRMFRLLALHPGPDITTPAAASLAGIQAADARRALAELANAQLLTEHVPGRFGLHDLLRSYATEQVRAAESADRQRAATRRVLDHYLHSAFAANQRLEGFGQPIRLATPARDVATEEFDGYTAAAAWFQSELQVLIAAIAEAARTGFATHAWQIAWTLRTFLRGCGRWEELAAVQRTGLATACDASDKAGQAHTHRDLAKALIKLGHHGEAFIHLQESVRLFTALEDLAGQAHARLAIAKAIEPEHRYGEALDHAERALEIYQLLGDRRGEAGSLNSVAWFMALQGDHAQAFVSCQRALSLYGEVSERPGEAAVWDTFGYVESNLGHHADAITCYHRALALFADLGDRHEQGSTLIRLGDACLAAWDPDSARQHWRQALSILESLDDPAADEARLRLCQSTAPEDREQHRRSSG